MLQLFHLEVIGGRGASTLKRLVRHTVRLPLAPIAFSKWESLSWETVLILSKGPCAARTDGHIVGTLEVGG